MTCGLHNNGKKMLIVDFGGNNPHLPARYCENILQSEQTQPCEEYDEVLDLQWTRYCMQGPLL